MVIIAEDLHDHAVISLGEKSETKFLEEENCQLLYHPHALYVIDVRF